MALCAFCLFSHFGALFHGLPGRWLPRFSLESRCSVSAEHFPPFSTGLHSQIRTEMIRNGPHSHCTFCCFSVALAPDAVEQHFGPCFMIGGTTNMFSSFPFPCF